jgi:hypothetical protein
MKKNTGMNSFWFRSLLTATAFMLAAGVLAPGPTDRAEAASASASPAATTEASPQRWSYVWQRWDGTNYSSQTTCLARGRAVMRNYPDVKDFTCRKPCGRWWLYTYRQQWV